MVDIDLLMEIWKNRVKKIDFVLKWSSGVGSEVGPTKGFMVLPAGQGQVPHPSIVPERFTINQLWNDRCTWPWGHCLLSELREWRLQTDRHNRLKSSAPH
ncbi:uncharacterized protein TNCV_4312331 [Trichonephila clavipes]|nr:uncharacterized protein TNCV_4312331 [Trichonephila clavipes]